MPVSDALVLYSFLKTWEKRDRAVRDHKIHPSLMYLDWFVRIIMQLERGNAD